MRALQSRLRKVSEIPEENFPCPVAAGRRGGVWAGQRGAAPIHTGPGRGCRIFPRTGGLGIRRFSLSVNRGSESGDLYLGTGGIRDPYLIYFKGDVGG